jgi:hypothetical protein
MRGLAGGLDPSLPTHELASQREWDIQVGRCGLTPLAPTMS